MKIVLAAINHDHPPAGMTRAFREEFGADNVLIFDYLDRQRQGVPVPEINRKFIDVCEGFQPDWIWLQLQETNVLSADTLLETRRRVPGAVLTHWMGDLRVSVPRYLLGVCKATHMTLVSNQGQIPMWEATGAPRVVYCQVAADWDEDIEGTPPWTPPFRVPDVVFCGNYYVGMFPDTEKRLEAVRSLWKAGLDVGVVGGGWPAGTPVSGRCGVKQQHHVYKRAKVALSINHFNGVQRYYSDRLFSALAAGCATVAHHVPGIEQDFQDGVHLLTYRVVGELVEKVKMLLADAGLRGRIGEAGKAEVVRAHTWNARIEALLPEVEKVRG